MISRLPAICLIALIVNPITTRASILIGGGANLDFTEASIDPGITYSPQWRLTGKGLEAKGVEGRGRNDLWIQTHRLSVVSTHRPPTEFDIGVKFEGPVEHALSFPQKVLVRYGLDGVHWTEWEKLPRQPFQRSKGLVPSTKPALLTLRVPPTRLEYNFTAVLGSDSVRIPADPGRSLR